MPRINREEYEVLKELDDKWKWIVFESPRIEIYEEKPYRDEYGKWWWRGYSDVSILDVDFFKFITTADEDPYNIAELIEEYEVQKKIEVSVELGEQVIRDHARKQLQEESEETEVKKDIEWLKKEFDEVVEFRKQPNPSSSWGMGRNAVLKYIKKDFENLINQLDEPEVLSQELPVIPKFVAEWIEETKRYNSLRVAFEYIAQRKKDNHVDEQLAFWVEEGNSETFARAWLDGYTVEEEQKYNVNFKFKSSFGTVGIFLYKEGDEVLAGDNFKAYYPKEDECRLTEQEIRGFQNGDILFEHFAVKVEELEE